ncbi:hypothetical protein CSB09_00895 [Candidatus Gracilibacteria bacterium]|nr:MAG: hypothetical protein CSB09_00895 [Candidatus Gracilibacteria bacterium]
MKGLYAKHKEKQGVVSARSFIVRMRGNGKILFRNGNPSFFCLEFTFLYLTEFILYTTKETQKKR